MKNPKPLAERFWPKVKKTKGCWWWTACKDKKGYGRISGTYAHRTSWVLHYGPIPKEMSVLHKCDNTSCVRPDHLFLGTQKDNIQDMINKGRKATTQGENSSNAKLKNNDIHDIRRLHSTGVKSKQIAVKFGIAPCTVRGIVYGRAWKHL